jgi:hypothetical protein
MSFSARSFSQFFPGLPDPAVDMLLAIVGQQEAQTIRAPHTQGAPVKAVKITQHGLFRTKGMLCLLKINQPDIRFCINIFKKYMLWEKTVVLYPVLMHQAHNPGKALYKPMPGSFSGPASLLPVLYTHIQ